ncbi:hypothetical protein EDL79_02010 [Ehrlichia ruminantium]|uniref:Uncharacterized protein n=1 Tax=Ehrlichia ruminantium TaxID=779 RepID=A0AAE6Q915_EHRRU|nr:hypothetical protein [Ehrlichia ruminantium]QGR02442.1 hypothetical protein EDL81_02015 [Ehrlichia ruminantium]QGR03361.1 hypothetical protein EDL80_02010 [Ehrlichia ruminantium]QGR04288.1 hypothetical protein EDL79_02010 [Ehrlichia ruminantium]
MFILNEIIEIKLQMINIFNIQIKYLQESDFTAIKDLQYIEQKLVFILDNKCKKIKHDIGIISLCKNQDIIELLKNVCLKYEEILDMRNKLFVMYDLNNKEQKVNTITQPLE